MSRQWHLFLISLLVRSLSLLSQTFFQPDEFYQSLEPAHHLVFGYGYLTWEWRDLPVMATKNGDDLIQRALSGLGAGRLRGWSWPGCFALVYWVLKRSGLDGTTWITRAPRIPLAIMAAATDYFTAALSVRLFGSESQQLALLLSVGNLFNAHALPRALSTSFETFLTIAALTYWPLPKTKGRSSLVVSLLLSAIAITVRPTNGVLWLCLGAELAWRVWGTKGVRGLGRLLGLVVGIGLTVLFLSTTLDYLVTGQLYLPLVSFFTQNLLLGISTFYGRSPWHYHLTQSVPILLTTATPFVIRGFMDTVLRRGRPASTEKTASPSLELLAWASFITITTFSLIPHKEWRFLHFLLPILLQFGVKHLLTIPETKRSKVLRWMTIISIVPAIYLGGFHGRGQVSVTDFLRTNLPLSQSVAVLMPCHSVPWQSHIHRRDLDGGGIWALSCEPPIGVKEQAQHVTEESKFYSNVTESFANVLDGLWAIEGGASRPSPTYLLIFGSLLDHQQVRLDQYRPVWFGWNGFDILQDDSRRRGGVHVLARRQ